MFTIDCISQENDSTLIRVQHPASQTSARIETGLGGSLQELILSGTLVIRERPEFSYDISKASALLFPFVNRLENGSYEFEGQRYQLPGNPLVNNAALHGLVFDENFHMLGQQVGEDFAEVQLEHRYGGELEGFPHPFSFQVTYKIGLSSLEVKVTGTNLGGSNFPFCVGWHPYFESPDLSRSRLRFEEQGWIESDEHGIGKRLIEREQHVDFDMNGRFLDDCFALGQAQAELQTPTHTLKLETTSTEPFMQFFTPPVDNLIAMEPTSGVSNTFNNGIGLRTLSPGESYSETWRVSIMV